jgi:spermidine/putrescine transport system substrate-binding protein
LLGGIGALGALSAAGLLAACRDDEGGTSGGGDPNRLNLLTWEGYDLPIPLMRSWQRKEGLEVKASYIASQNDVQAKLVGGKGGFDLSTYNPAYADLYKELGLIAPLEPDKIPNLKLLYPGFGDNPAWHGDGDTLLGVPFTWGSLGITYDSAAIAAPRSWFDLLKPEFKGRIGVPDSPPDILGLATHILGLDVKEITEADKEKIVKLLRQFVEQSAGVSPSYGDMTTRLVSGDAVACFCGWAAMNQYAVDAGSNSVRTVLPKEGSASFSDGYFIPEGAKNTDAAYAWMNHAIVPQVNAQAAENLVGGVTVRGATEFLNPTIRRLYNYANLDQLLAVAPFYSYPPSKSDEFMTIAEWQETWGEIKQV